MRRWQTSEPPSSSPITRYFPRRPTPVTAAPCSAWATASESAGAVSLPSRISTRSSVLPASATARPRRTVSTSGSSGIEPLDHERRRAGGPVCELEAAPHGGHVECGPRVHRRQRITCRHGVAPLSVDDDADRVIDRVCLGGTTGAEPRRSLSDRQRMTPLDHARGVRGYLFDDWRAGERRLRITALGRDPALPALVRGAAFQRALGR